MSWQAFFILRSGSYVYYDGNIQERMERLGSAPKRIRTSDLPLRRRTLYPAELSGRLLETLDELETLAG